ncbi:hypothetical protein C1A50_3729 [Paenibacillus polymyxa]|nr:hypothetical protein C1A50_3729 [Paenibacillus polymyxa]
MIFYSLSTTFKLRIFRKTKKGVASGAPLENKALHKFVK